MLHKSGLTAPSARLSALYDFLACATSCTSVRVLEQGRAGRRGDMGFGRITRVVVGAGLLAATACSANGDSNAASVSPLVVRSGSAMVTIGDEESEALVQSIDGGVGIETAGLTMAITGFSGESNGRLTISRGQAIAFQASGLQAGSTAEVWIFSTPQLLGTIEVDNRGHANGSLSLSEDFEGGQHQLQLRGIHLDGAPLVVALNVAVNDASDTATRPSDSIQEDTPSSSALNRPEPPESSESSESPSPSAAETQAEQARQAAERAAAERAEEERRAAAERAEQERQAAEARAEEERQSAERAAAERAEQERRAAERAAAEAQAAQRAESAAREEVLAAARIAAEQVTQQEANIWAADAEQYCRDRAMDIRVANASCPGVGRRAGEEHYATMIGPITAAVEAEYMALYYFDLYDQYYRQFLSEAGY